MRLLNSTALILVVGLLAGCDSFDSFLLDQDLNADEAASAVVGPGLWVHLFAPDTVAVRDSFVVRFVVQNRTGNDQTVVTPSTCLVVPGIFESSGFDGIGERVPFRGSNIGCGAAIWDHKIPEGKSEERTFDMQAVLPRYDEGVDDEPVPPGRYTLRVKLNWTIEGERMELSALERELVVRR